MTPCALDAQECPEEESTLRSEVMVRGGKIEMVPGTDSEGIRNEGKEENISISSSKEGSIASCKPKHTALKRVSFGSSKGSMVETMLFDKDVITPYRPVSHINPAIMAIAKEEQISSTPPSKVRVTFFESQKPHFVTTPDSSEFSFNLLSLSSTMASPEDVQKFISMNIGVDNPFRPEGELSREAEDLVRQVRTGQPLSPAVLAEEALLQRSAITSVTSEPTPSANGVHISTPLLPAAMVEVQHGIVVPPSSSSNVEQVVIKKKPRCHCCVIT